MKRILTGIQSSGKQHLGNILGAILPAITLSKHTQAESLFFIADMHTLTTVKDPNAVSANTYSAAAAWLACGLDINNTIFYRQSDVAQVSQLAWILNCVTPFPMLANAHSFKDKSSKLADVNAGLFTYPVLMAADILLYNADTVPVGKDQIQHLEMTRDIASAFNNIYGETFVLPNAKTDDKMMTIPGIDGQKMSKSYNNYIDIFLPEKELKKVVMSIVTDSTPLEEPKDPETCNVFKIYSLLASKEQTSSLAVKYKAGNFGYGHAKNELLALILESFSAQRTMYAQISQDKTHLDQQLSVGAEKAAKIANATLKEVRHKVGFL